MAAWNHRIPRAMKRTAETKANPTPTQYATPAYRRTKAATPQLIANNMWMISAVVLCIGP